MSVVVDPTFRADGPRGFKYWCHMSSDDLTPNGLIELHEMARKIGMKRDWFQDKTGHPHYDLVPGRRVMAVKLGAVEVTQQEYALRVSFPRRLKSLRDAREELVGMGEKERVEVADRAIARLESLMQEEIAEYQS